MQEYWIIDPKRHESSFYQRQPTGLYARIETSLSDSYQTPLLPQLSLHIPRCGRMSFLASPRSSGPCRTCWDAVDSGVWLALQNGSEENGCDSTVTRCR